MRLAACLALWLAAAGLARGQLQWAGQPLEGPVIRPSLGEVASELGRKYLNLDRRPKAAEPATEGPPNAAERDIAVDNSTLALPLDPLPAAKPRRPHKPEDDDQELARCRHYLQQHHSSGWPEPAGSELLQLPCGCERRLAEPESEPQVWLSCDHVQLAGGQLSARGPAAANTSGELVARFSQRDAGLQSLQAQKFHHLHLWRLVSVDLSWNRLRDIKLDAFHGLEQQLEQLNLAHNLLGDSRALPSGGGPVLGGPARRGRHTAPAQQLQVVFGAGQQLAKLARLRWLSLRSNLIAHIGPAAFRPPPPPLAANGNHQNQAQNQNQNQNGQAQQASELLHLDLSDNLLAQVPSEAIQRLDKLQTLRLQSNRITQLDELSKFPRSLTRLDLSDNLIKTVRHCDLIDLAHLLELDLSRNQLSALDKSAFVSSAAAALAQPAPPSALAASLAGLGDYDSALAPASNHQRAKRQTLLPLEEPEVASKATEMRFVDEEAPRAGLGPPQPGQRRALEEAQVDGEARAGAPRLELFGSVRLLNLSHNYFERIPGDSLVKFARLAELDMSHNRIRSLDSNYLCSLYNLVDSLTSLQLSGNLLSLAPTSGAAGANHSTASEPGRASARHELGRVFGCLQRLEKLSLSTNRLTAATTEVAGHPNSELSARSSGESNFNGRQFDDYNADNMAAEDELLDELNSASSEQIAALADERRLVLNFGDGFGARLLNSLDLSDNGLERVPLVHQHAPQPPVHVDRNSSSVTSDPSQLSEFLLNSHIHLQVLRLSLNQIQRLEEAEFEHFYNLRELHLDYNKLSQLPVRVFRRFTNLDTLTLSGNQLAWLEPLDELLERSVRSLRVLRLANNRLAEWPRLRASSGDGHQPEMGGQRAAAFNSASGGHNGRPGSTYPTSTATSGPEPSSPGLGFGLEELDLEGNLLSSGNVSSLFDQLVHMRHLRHLNLNYNLLSRVRSEWFKFANRNLRQLSLSGNKINTIDLGAFAASQADELRQLRLDFNLVRELRRKTFDSLGQLRELDLSHNLIHTIASEALYQLPALQVLKLSHNRLSSWKCEYFANLCNSHSGNINADLDSLLTGEPGRLQGAPAGQRGSPRGLAPVSALLELDLSHNQLSQLRVNSISVHTKLLRLNLEHNKLSFLPHDLFKASASDSQSGRHVQLVSALRELKIGHNHIQTIDNVNFRPLRNLLRLDLSFNELQTLGVDLISADQEAPVADNRRLIVSSNLTSWPLGEPLPDEPLNEPPGASNGSRPHSWLQGGANWPALAKLRHLNLAHNQLTQVNQSLLAELSPFVALNLNLSSNFLEDEALARAFYAKISQAQAQQQQQLQQQGSTLKQPTGQVGQRPTSGYPGSARNYDMIFVLKLESLDLSRNRLNELPAALLESHYNSLELCNLGHNRIQKLAANSNALLQIKSLTLESNPLTREANELLLYEQKNARHLNLASSRLYAILQTSQQSSLEVASGAGGSGRRRSVHNMANLTAQLDLIRSISRPIDAPYLRSLNLSNNQLVWLAANVFERMHSLQLLDLSHNQLTRLNLLNNPIAHVAPSLEYLNLASNLFTSVDANDLSQLTKLKHLDLSHLMSLQKFNCKFLAKLPSLEVLRLFNYPQLRQSTNSLYATLVSSYNNRTTSTHYTHERLRRKIRHELQYSTLGPHCLQPDLLGPEPAFQAAPTARHLQQTTTGSPAEQQLSVGPQTIARDEQQQQQPQHRRWLGARDLELELLGTWSQFEAEPATGSSSADSYSGGFELRSELACLLGPRLARLSIYGHNLTSIGPQALVGVTGERLQLRISYTSLAEVPLEALLASVSRRTRLELDLRHNNIRSVEARQLQLLDELQQAGAGEPSSGPPLRLSSNPITCDCHTRPLWLWLNQRGGSPGALAATAAAAAAAQASADGAPQQMDEPASYSSSSQAGSQADSLASVPPTTNYWLRLNSIAHTNELKCYQPAKLRGKLAQHVSYNELVCKGPQAVPAKRNASTTELGGELEAEEQLLADLDLQQQMSGGFNRPAVVVLTRFNRFPARPNASMAVPEAGPLVVPFEPYSTQNNHDQAGSDTDSDIGGPGRSQLAKRVASLGAPDAASGSFVASSAPANSLAGFNKHRPNTLQRHSPHNSLGGLTNQARQSHGGHQALSSTGLGASGVNGGKASLLSDLDVIILASTSGAMILMSFVILVVCLYKQKLERTDRELILSGGSEASDLTGAMTAAAIAAQQRALLAASGGSRMAPRGAGGSSGSHSGGSPGSSSSQTHSKGAGSRLPGPNQFGPSQHVPGATVLMPLVTSGAGAGKLLTRSPTIRRVHGLASNASDWFKFTLRAYPGVAPAGRQRRPAPTFTSGPGGAAPAAGSKAPVEAALARAKTGAPAAVATRSQFQLFDPNKPAPAAGCPVHAFKQVHRLHEAGRRRISVPEPLAEAECVHCARLLAAVRSQHRSKQRHRLVTAGATGGLAAMAPGNTATRYPDSMATARARPEEEPVSSPRLIMALKRKFDQQPDDDHDHDKEQAGLEWRQHVSSGPASQRSGCGPALASNSTTPPSNQAEDSQPQRAKLMRTFGLASGSSSSSCSGPSGTGPNDEEGQADEHPNRHHHCQNINPAELAELALLEARFNRAERDKAAFGDQGPLGGAPGSSQTLPADTDSTMHGDECSRSSSPAVYGFMRSSPSATTLSSVAPGAHFRLAPDSPAERLSGPNERGGSPLVATFDSYRPLPGNWLSHTSPPVNYDTNQTQNNNNNNEPAGARKAMAQLASDDQMIISRL